MDMFYICFYIDINKVTNNNWFVLRLINKYELLDVNNYNLELLLNCVTSSETQLPINVFLMQDIAAVNSNAATIIDTMKCGVSIFAC